MTDNEFIQSSESQQELAYLRAEVEHLRRRLGTEGSTDSRLSELEAKLAATSSQNERLTSTLREARDQIVTLKEEVDRLAQPPTGFGTFLQRNDDESVDVFTGGRKLRVNVSPSVDKEALQKGQEVILNEAMCLAKFSKDIAAASWDSVIFDLPGQDSLQRIPTMEPLRGTAEHVGRLFETSNTASELFAAITGR